MKDKDLRKRVTELEVQLDVLPRLWVRFCKKCGHDTGQVRDTGIGYFYTIIKTYDFKCLNCGTKWNCHEETVCQEVVDESIK